MIITVKPPEDARRKLLVPGGETLDDFHITLFYIEDETFSTIVECCESILTICKLESSISCSVEELGRFSLVKGFESPTDVIYAGVESKSLHRVRERLRVKLDEFGIPYSTLHKDFVPHISLKYVLTGEDIDAPIALPINFSIDCIEIWTKEKERHSFLLKG